MIKTGDKGTISGFPARVIADDLGGDYPLAIAYKFEDGEENLLKKGSDGTGNIAGAFIPSKPWDSLKPGDACFVREYEHNEWKPRVFAGVDNKNKRPMTFDINKTVSRWRYCIPAKLIDGELIRVEDE